MTARVLVDEVREGGTHHERWDGRLAAGTRATPGMYLAVLRTEGTRHARRFVVVP
jgi:hypothetical protein